jgi:glycosyltransferase involved in cell wall biosynthesis
MRVLHVHKFLFRAGGSDAYVQDVADLQRATGDEVAFFGMQHPDNIPTGYESHYPSYVAFDPPPPTLPGKVRAGARMLWSRSARIGIDAVIEEFRPDIAHLHGIYHQLSPSVLRPLKRHRVPTVMTLHDYKLACPTYRFLDHGRVCEACIGGKFHHAVLRRCRDGSLTASAMLAGELALHTLLGAYSAVNLFLCPSRFMVSKMSEAGVYPDRLRHLPLFSDVAGLTPKEGLGGAILYAGRLSEEKGVDVLIRAAGLLEAGSVVEVAGDGPQAAGLRQLADEVAPGRVRFLGWLGKHDLHRVLRAASVLVLPARWYENQPISILEALGSGVPVLTTTLGGAPELIDHGVDGLLVPPDDSEALASALRGLVADPERAAAMGRAGRRKVERDFAPANHLAGLRHLYEEAADLADVRR